MRNTAYQCQDCGKLWAPFQIRRNRLETIERIKGKLYISDPECPNCKSQNLQEKSYTHNDNKGAFKDMPLTHWNNKNDPN